MKYYWVECLDGVAELREEDLTEAEQKRLRLSKDREGAAAEAVLRQRRLLQQEQEYLARIQANHDAAVALHWGLFGKDVPL